MEESSELQDNVLVGSELLTTSLPNHIYVLETASERSTIEIILGTVESVRKRLKTLKTPALHTYGQSVWVSRCSLISHRRDCGSDLVSETEISQSAC